MDLYKIRASIHDAMITSVIGRQAKKTEKGNMCQACKSWVTVTHQVSPLAGIDSRMVTWHTAYLIALRHKSIPQGHGTSQHITLRQQIWRQRILLQYADHPMHLCYACFACSSIKMNERKRTALQVDISTLPASLTNSNCDRSINHIEHFTKKHTMGKTTHQEYFSPLTDVLKMNAKTKDLYNITSTTQKQLRYHRRLNCIPRATQPAIEEHYKLIEDTCKEFLTAVMHNKMCAVDTPSCLYQYPDHADDHVLDPKGIVDATYTAEDNINYTVYVTGTQQAVTHNYHVSTDPYDGLVAYVLPTKSHTKDSPLTSQQYSQIRYLPYQSAAESITGIRRRPTPKKQTNTTHSATSSI